MSVTGATDVARRTAGVAWTGTDQAAAIVAPDGEQTDRFFVTHDNPGQRSVVERLVHAGVAEQLDRHPDAPLVTFLWAADKQLRDVICDSTDDSCHAGHWVAGLFHRARDRGNDHAHAVRVLARAWVDIIWARWTLDIPYDPTFNQDRNAAARRRATHAFSPRTAASPAPTSPFTSAMTTRSCTQSGLRSLVR